MCHTRELAFQISKEYERFSKYMEQTKIAVFFGGMPVDKDKKTLKENCPHIVVGTPGRILGLVRSKALDLKKVMQDPLEVFIDDEAKLTLHGLQQHTCKLSESEKNRKLFDLLDALEFNQVVIFVKSVQRCIALATLLKEQNFPAIDIHRAMNQEERLARYQKFKNFQSRILVATNLFGRGMDIERVNIVFNYDMPEDSDTYLHRVARAGRFGTKGLAISFIADDEDTKIMESVQKRFEVTVTDLSEEIDISTYIEGR